MSRLFLSTLATVIASFGAPAPSGQSTNQALALDGDGDEVFVPFAAGLDLTTTFTIEAWIWHEEPLDQGFLTKFGPVVSRKASVQAPWNASYELGSVLVTLSTFSAHRNGVDGNCFYGSRIALGRWVHWAWVHRPEEDLLYRNGRLDAVADLPDPASSSMPLHIGHRVGHPGSPEVWLRGMVDDLRLWTRVRTMGELRDTINASIRAEDVAQFPGLSASWTFDGDALDATGIHHGQLVGDAHFVPAPDRPVLVFGPSGLRPQAPVRQKQ